MIASVKLRSQAYFKAHFSKSLINMFLFLIEHVFTNG